MNDGWLEGRRDHDSVQLDLEFADFTLTDLGQILCVYSVIINNLIKRTVNET